MKLLLALVFALFFVPTDGEGEVFDMPSEVFEGGWIQ